MSSSIPLSKINEAPDAVSPPSTSPQPREAASSPRDSTSVKTSKELAPRRWIDIGALFPTLLDAKQHTMFQKVVILMVVSIVTLSAPFTGNAFLPAFPAMRLRLDADQTAVNLTTTVYLVALGICPMWHAYLSERYGRRPVYIFTTIIFVVASVALARATTISVVVGLRFLQAVGGSTAQSVGAGTLSDVFLPHQRGRAFGVYYIFPNLGPLLAPVLGGLLVTWHGWHAIAWFLALYGVAMWIMLFFLLPETSVAVKARQALARLPAPTISSAPVRPLYVRVQGTLYDFLVRPVISIKFLTFPPIGLTTLYLSICFSCIFAYSTTIPYQFSTPPYNFTPIIVSLMFLGGCFGQIAGSVTAGFICDRVVKRAKAIHGDNYQPESRLQVAWLGVPFVPIGLLVYGWTVETNQFWLVPLIGTFLFCLGLQLSTTPIIAYYSDAVPGKTASIVAVHNLCRMLSGALTSAVTPTAVRSIGTGWYLTILAVLCALGAIALEAVRRWGSVWRRQRDERESRKGQELANRRPASKSPLPAGASTPK